MRSVVQPYDYCAMVPVIEGAGGVITDWQGAPLGLASDGRTLAAGDARLCMRWRAACLPEHDDGVFFPAGR